MANDAFDALALGDPWTILLDAPIPGAIVGTVLDWRGRFLEILKINHESAYECKVTDQGPTPVLAIEDVTITIAEITISGETAAEVGSFFEPATTIPHKPSPPSVDAMATQSEIARGQGYTGDCCSHCGLFRMKQAGHCLTCDSCGETTGCS